MRKKENGYRLSQDHDDDLETIVDMNVDGMPWYRPDLKEKQKILEDAKRAGMNTSGGGEEFTKDQIRMYRWAALKAALLIALVFGVVFFLFLLFCDLVWFK